MRIGIPRELKNNENRVGITPQDVKQFITHGHTIYVESQAGIGSGFSDEDYANQGAIILEQASEVWNLSDLIIKIKEPLTSEYNYFREGLIIFTYLHLAADKALTLAMLKSKVIGLAYETVELADHSLPLLTPSSEIAGKIAVQVGAHYLEKHWGGAGILLSGAQGVPPAKVVIIGGGHVGYNAAKLAHNMGAFVTVLDLSESILNKYQLEFKERMTTLISNPTNIANALKTCDLLICAVLLPGSKAPRIVSEENVKSMKKGAVIVDVSIDQGGIVETIDHVTTHENPIYLKYGVVHYSVPNMPGTFPKTATLALTHATLPYSLMIANKGWKQALREDSALAKSANIIMGEITYKGVADAFALSYTKIEELLND